MEARRAKRANVNLGLILRWAVGGLLVLAVKLPGLSLAQSAPPLAGDYVCAYGCRMTDANPSIAIKDEDADCMNEFGGLFHGKALSQRSVACFHKIGRLSPDGTTILWDDGVIWKRHLPAPRVD